MKTSRRFHRGFTLIELLLVMVIIVILASVVVPQFNKKSNLARIAAAKTDIKNYETALSAFEIDCGRFPTTDEGLSVLVSNPGTASWNGPYVKIVNPDPWQKPYVYQEPGTHFPDSFDLYSAGPDQHDGNEDDIANWQS